MINQIYFHILTYKLLIITIILLFSGCASVPKEYSMAEKLYKKGQYIEAYEHYKAALSKLGNEQERLKIDNTLKNLQETIIQDSLAQAQKLHDTQPASLSSLTEAIGILNRALSYDDSRGLIQAALTAYRAERGTFQDRKAQLANRAEELYLDGRLPEVIPVYEEILSLEPQNKQIKLKLDDIRREIEVRKERYRKNIEEYLQSGNVDIAKYFMDKLINLAPDHPETGQLRKRIDESWDQGILRSHQALQEREKWLQASKTYQERQAQSQQQGQQGMNFLYSGVKERGGKYYYEKSIRRFVEKDIYAAYGAALKARMLEPDDIGISMVYEKCEASLDKAVQIKIMVTPFQGLSSYGGRALSETLSDYLYSRLPYGVTILDSGAKKGSSSEPDILISGHAQDSRSDNPQLTIRITDRQGSFMDYADSVDLTTANNNIEALASQIGEIILRYLGQQEKKYYQLAYLYLERNQTEKALKPLALGAFFCQRTNKSNEYCSNLQNLLLSASE